MRIFSKLLETIRMNRALVGRIQTLKRQQATILETLRKQDAARLHSSMSAIRDVLTDLEKRQSALETHIREESSRRATHSFEDRWDAYEERWSGFEERWKAFEERRDAFEGRWDAFEGRWATSSRGIEQQFNQLANRQTRVLAEVRQIHATLSMRMEELKIEQGRLLAAQNRDRRSRNLQDYEFKVFSQWGEDGILQHLVRQVEIAHPTFIEFGVQDFHESNCRFLMMKDHWRGFVMDGSAENIERLKRSYYYWRYDLQARAEFVSTENINRLLAASGFDSDLGILSVDLDGVDYWIYEAIEGFRPRILVLEYNAVLGKSRPLSVPYDETFVRTEAHHSNLYFGASLPALVHLANKRGYSLVGCNRGGVNAFFVRTDLIHDALPEVSVEEAFTPSGHRESRDEEGNLTFTSGEERLEMIRGLPVVNVTTGEREEL